MIGLGLLTGTLLGAAACLGPAVAIDARTPETFSVTAFGAIPDDGRDDSEALRAAISAATEAREPAVVTLPAGTLDLAPARGEKWVWSFTSRHRIEVQGAGRDATILRLWAAPTDPSGAWRDPNDPIKNRGGLFRVSGEGTQAAFADFTIDGQADPTPQAGLWPGVDAVGWDISHKAIGCWDGFAQVDLERMRIRRFRGEMVYAGGDERNGLITMADCILSECNASAISCTASMEIDRLDLSDAYNGFENFLFPEQTCVIRDSTIEPGRNLPYSKFGLVFLGVRSASVLIEGCTIGAGQGRTKGGSAATLYFSEFCHNVTVRDSILHSGTVGAHIVGINTYAEIREHNGGFTNINFENVTYRATRGETGFHYCFLKSGVDWNWRGCRFEAEDGATARYLGQFPGGVRGVIEDCDFSNLQYVWEPVLYHGDSHRPVFRNNRNLPAQLVNKFHHPTKDVGWSPRWPGVVEVTDWRGEGALFVDPDTRNVPDGWRNTFRVRAGVGPVSFRWPGSAGEASTLLVAGRPITLQWNAETRTWRVVEGS